MKWLQSEYDKNFIKLFIKHDFCSINKSDENSSINWFNYFCNKRLVCRIWFILNTHMHTVKTKSYHTRIRVLTFGNVLPRVIMNYWIYIQILIRTSQMPYVRIGISSQHWCCTHTTTHTHTDNYLIMQCGLVVIKLSAKLMKTELENFPFDANWTSIRQFGTQNITKLYSLRNLFSQLFEQLVPCRAALPHLYIFKINKCLRVYYKRIRVDLIWIVNIVRSFQF